MQLFHLLKRHNTADIISLLLVSHFSYIFPKELSISAISHFPVNLLKSDIIPKRAENLQSPRC